MRGKKMGYLSRKPTSNDLDSQKQRSPWGGDEFLDDTVLLLNGLGKRCAACKQVARNQFLENGLCPGCRTEDIDGMSEIHKPEYLNLYDLAHYVKAYLSDLLNGTCSERGAEWGNAWITELVQRLGEIKKDLGISFLTIALHKTAIASGFTDGCERLSQLCQVIEKVRQSFLKFLKNPQKAKKRAQKLKLFCEILCQKMPYEERFKPGPVVPEIKIPRSTRRNYMANGQPGEAD